jgi:Flp pilus assembly protein TadD
LWFARFEAANGGIDLARHYLARSINLDTHDSSPWRAWAELERRAGKEDKARFMFRRAADLDSSRSLFKRIDCESPLKRPWNVL